MIEEGSSGRERGTMGFLDPAVFLSSFAPRKDEETRKRSNTHTKTLPQIVEREEREIENRTRIKSRIEKGERREKKSERRKIV